MIEASTVAVAGDGDIQSDPPTPPSPSPTDDGKWPNLLLCLDAHIIALCICWVRDAIGNGGPVGYTLALVTVFGLVGAALDVGMDVEVAEEDEHDDHVAGQEVLAPVGEVTAHT